MAYNEAFKIAGVQLPSGVAVEWTVPYCKYTNKYTYTNENKILIENDNKNKNKLKSKNENENRYTNTNLNTFVYIYTCTYVYVCICVCAVDDALQNTVGGGKPKMMHYFNNEVNQIIQGQIRNDFFFINS